MDGKKTLLSETKKIHSIGKELLEKKETALHTCIHRIKIYTSTIFQILIIYKSYISVEVMINA